MLVTTNFGNKYIKILLCVLYFNYFKKCILYLYFKYIYKEYFVFNYTSLVFHAAKIISLSTSNGSNVIAGSDVTFDNSLLLL